MHRGIKEIVGKEQIVDKETREYRPVEYGDIVILLRTAYGWAETFREVLASQGIPYIVHQEPDIFSATEIVTVLNYLKVCDNPLQDIPLMGVLLFTDRGMHFAGNWQNLGYSILMVCSMRVFQHMWEK